MLERDHINKACVKSISEENVLSQKLESSGIVIYVRYSVSCQRELRHGPQYLTWTTIPDDSSSKSGIPCQETKFLWQSRASEASHGGVAARRNIWGVRGAKRRVVLACQSFLKGSYDINHNTWRGSIFAHTALSQTKIKSWQSMPLSALESSGLWFISGIVIHVTTPIEKGLAS